jgi:hypothetical protein
LVSPARVFPVFSLKENSSADLRDPDAGLFKQPAKLNSGKPNGSFDISHGGKARAWAFVLRQ